MVTSGEGWPRVMTKLVRVVACVYIALVIALVVLLLGYADRWWLGSLLAFGPRWPLLLPLALALFTRDRAVWIGLALTGLVVAGPFMGFSFGTDCGEPPATSSHVPLKIITFNTGAGRDASGVMELLAAESPDIAMLQECHPGHATPPGYQLVQSSALCFVSRLPIARVDARTRADVWQRGGSGEITMVEITTKAGPLYVLNVHLETVRHGLEALMAHKLDGVGQMEGNIALRRWESELARAWAARAEGPLIIAGDFNIPTESAIYQTSWSGFGNAFDACGYGYGRTKETRWFGVRIDHVLYSGALACDAARLGPASGSDHRPLVVDVRLMP